MGFEDDPLTTGAYEPYQVQALVFQPYSNKVWSASEPARQNLLSVLESATRTPVSELEVRGVFET